MFKIFAASLLLLFAGTLLQAQPVVIKDYSTLMEIPDMVTLESSPAHIYVMTQSEGLAVFRTSADTLQWLYTSPNMQRRGSILNADIRFAYLFGADAKRFTVIEPTSLLGVYSSTKLPWIPKQAARLDDHVYIAFGENGLGRLSLETPESVDSEPEMLLSSESNPNIISVVSDYGRLFALDTNRRIFFFTSDGDEITSQTPVRLQQNLVKLFLTGEQLYGTTAAGEVYRIGSGRNITRVFSIPAEIKKLEKWGDFYVVSDSRNLVWLADKNGTVHPFRDSAESGNLFTISKNNLWMSEYNQLSLLLLKDEVAGAPEDDDDIIDESVSTSNLTLNLKLINDIVLPFPRPLILPIQTTENFPANEIRFQVRSRLNNLQVRNHGLFWQPGARDVGHHRITIIASTQDGQTDSTSFMVEVKTFNAPPRFSPVRALSIPVNEEFELPIRATDPDGTNPDLIRYIGIDLPDGANIDERTGKFRWTPHRRQTGEHKFDVIATDQYGAAASITITINVVALGRDS